MDPVSFSRQAVDLLGVFGNAILGGLAARAARLDIFGFIILAIMSGLGGGMIRDALLQRGPVVALTDPYYLGVAVVGAVIAYLLNFTGKAMRRSLVVLDSLAVGCWAAVGTQKGLDADLFWLPAILLGVVTAIGGGMVRDIMLLKRPAVLGGNTLYATSALAAALLMVLAHALARPGIGFALAIAVGAAISLLARRYRWVLPTQPRPLGLEQMRQWRVFNPTWRRTPRRRRFSGGSESDPESPSQM